MNNIPLEYTDKWMESDIDDLRRLTEYQVPREDIFALLSFEKIVFNYCKLKDMS